MNHIQNATIELAGSVKYNGTTPLDAKLLVDTKADLKAIDSEYDYAIGDLVYCKEDNSYYQFNPSFSEAETGFFKKVYISTEPTPQAAALTPEQVEKLNKIDTLSGADSLVGSVAEARKHADDLNTALAERVRQLEERPVPVAKDEILVTTQEEFNRKKEAGELTQEVIFIKEA